MNIATGYGTEETRKVHRPGFDVILFDKAALFVASYFQTS